MRHSWVLVVVAAACGKGGGDKPGTGSSGASGSNAAAPAIPSAKKRASGEIHLSGALTGTYTWKEDLDVDTCGYVDSLKAGGLGLTMTDGKDSFISLRAIVTNDHARKIVLTGGKLKLPHAASMTGSDGFEMTGTDHGDDSTVAVTYKNATVTADGLTVTIDGQVAGNCKYSQ